MERPAATPKSQQNPETVAVLGKDGIPWSYVPLGTALDYIKELYDSHGESFLGVPVVHLWLVRSKGIATDPVFILQRRSDNGKLDKAVGGHVSDRHGHDPDIALLHEASEEMGGVHLNFVGLGRTALKGVNPERRQDTAVVYRLGDPAWVISGRYGRDGSYHEKPTMLYSYCGVYDGPLDSIESDYEVSGFVEMPLSAIREMMKLEMGRNLFTPDVQQLIEPVAVQIMSMASR